MILLGFEAGGDKRALQLHLKRQFHFWSNQIVVEVTQVQGIFFPQCQPFPKPRNYSRFNLTVPYGHK